ncbi:hypothetical protein ACFQZ4_22310 [Catellatospora coxensis]
MSTLTAVLTRTASGRALNSGASVPVDAATSNDAPLRYLVTPPA